MKDKNMKRDAVTFLKEEFQNAMNEIADSEFYTGILKRKYTHSRHVLENGIEIIKHDIPQLSKQPQLEQQKQLAKYYLN